MVITTPAVNRRQPTKHTHRLVRQLWARII